MARWIVNLNKFSTSLTSALHSVIRVTPWWFLCQARRSFGLSQSSCVRCSFDAGLALFGTSRIIGMTAWKVRSFNVHNGLTQTPCRVTPSDSWVFGARDAIARSITSRRHHSYRGGSGVVEDNLDINFLLVLQTHWCSIVAQQKDQAICALRCRTYNCLHFC